MMQLWGATWSGDDSELNLAPGQVAMSSANYRVQRLGGCNNHLKEEIKATLNGVLCSRPHLMPCGLFKPNRGRCFKCLLLKPDGFSEREQRQSRTRWRRDRSQWSGCPRAAAAGPGRCCTRLLRTNLTPRPEPPVASNLRQTSVSLTYSRGWGTRRLVPTTLPPAKRKVPLKSPFDASILSPQTCSGVGKPRTAAAPGRKRRRVAALCLGDPAPSSRPRSCRS